MILGNCLYKSLGEPFAFLKTFALADTCGGKWVQSPPSYVGWNEDLMFKNKMKKQMLFNLDTCYERLQLQEHSIRDSVS